jgi:2-polyprenyl-3-methyl-5-hydroxy-6-metoxy-1,4-benzoquinol methylase
VKVLDVYSGQPKNLETVFSGAEITHEHILELDMASPELYDVVYCSHALQFVPRQKVPLTIEALKAKVKSGGELWFITPSLEWAASQVVRNEPNPLIQTTIYGNGEEVYRSGFTLLWLRALLENIGLIVRKATQQMWMVKQGEDTLTIPENVVVAMRYDG